MDSELNKVLCGAVKSILKPLVRVLIKNEMTVSDFSEIVREAYVEVAQEHFAIPDKKLTAARIAVLTGLSRKEVMRLNKKSGNHALKKQSSPNRAQRVIHGWLGDREFLTKKNTPRVLPMFGESQSFTALVSRYSGDVTAGAIRDELLRSGAVEVDHKSRIRLVKIGFVPSKDELEKIKLMATGASDMLHTAVHNIECSSKDPKFQRTLCYQFVSTDVMAAFKHRSAEMSARYLQDLNQLIIKLINREKEKKKKLKQKNYFDDAESKDSARQQKDNE